MNDVRWSRLSRRALLAGGASAVVGAGLLRGAAPAGAATYDYTSRADFDRFLADYEASGADGQPDDNNEDGALAWGRPMSCWLWCGCTRPRRTRSTSIT
ncbi:hypothetical protein [Flindersiella endophytica]